MLVIIETGHTFERNSIEEWLKIKNTCPISRTFLKTKSLTPNISLKSTINENIEKFIKKVIKHVVLWLDDNNLVDICSNLVDDSLELIKNNFTTLQKELKMLYFDILLNKNIEEQELFDKYINLINELSDLNEKIEQLQKLQNKLMNEILLQKYYNELISLIIQSKNKTVLFEVFKKYIKLNNLDNILIDKVLKCIKNKDIKLNCFILLFNYNSKYNRNILLQKLLNIKIPNKLNNNFAPFFKNLLKQVDLTEIDLDKLINFIKNCNELKEEKIIFCKELYKNSNNIKYLELEYELNNSNKETELLLLSEYLKLNLMNKYLNLYIKINETKLDSFNIMLLKYLQNQNNEINTLQNENKILKNNLNNVEKSLINLNDWKNQQVIYNFKTKYSDYDYVNIIKIITPLNVKKNEEYFSEEFEVFGLKWKMEINPKGDNDSKEDECAIWLHLTSLQCEKEKEIFAIRVKYCIDNTNLSDNKNYTTEYTKIEGKGCPSFKQHDFIPIIRNDKQTFNVVIGMKNLETKFKFVRQSKQ
ncbi:hypothetical protein ABK040_001783 [Willaertia magna]